MARPTDIIVIISLQLVSLGLGGLGLRFPSSTIQQHGHMPWSGYSTHLLSHTSLWSPKEFKLLEKPGQSMLYGDEGSAAPAKSPGANHGLPASMNIIDPDKYYDEWHRVLSGYTTHRCHPIPINMTLCQNVGYQRMILPNYLHHEDVKEVVEQSQIWLSLVHSECHPDLRKFLCSLYAPVCVEEDQQILIDPCRELCEDVKQRCLPKMLQFGFGWPDVVKCTRFTASDSKMCIPKSETVRHSCSGCVPNSKFESVISGYCTADVVLRARILYAFQSNSTSGSVYTLKLDRQPRVLKSLRKMRIPMHLHLRVDCECALLNHLLTQNPRRLGRWIIMGKHSDNLPFLQVEHMSQITRGNVGLRQAIRAMRNPSPSLCQLPELDASQHDQTGADSRDDSLQFLGFRQQANHTRFHNLGATDSQMIQSTAPTFSLPKNRGFTTMARRPRNQAMSRSLVRRSQYHKADLRSKHQSRSGGRGLSTRHSHGNREVQSKRLSLERSGMSLIRGGERSRPTRKARITLDSEKDLFSPLHFTPWLK